jgi:DNA helicase-2/ATP-dependent DNA helicase PcrA
MVRRPPRLLGGHPRHYADLGCNISYGGAVTMVGSAHGIPTLEGEAANAVAHRGGHLQIIAAAGSGKTEVVSQRVAALIAEG